MRPGLKCQPSCLLAFHSGRLHYYDLFWMCRHLLRITFRDTEHQLGELRLAWPFPYVSIKPGAPTLIGVHDWQTCEEAYMVCSFVIHAGAGVGGNSLRLECIRLRVAICGERCN
jgi:hypothetical protein